MTRNRWLCLRVRFTRFHWFYESGQRVPTRAARLDSAALAVGALHRRRLAALPAASFAGDGHVIVDECHHLSAQSFERSRFLWQELAQVAPASVGRLKGMTRVHNANTPPLTLRRHSCQHPRSIRPACCVPGAVPTRKYLWSKPVSRSGIAQPNGCRRRRRCPERESATHPQKRVSAGGCPLRRLCRQTLEGAGPDGHAGSGERSFARPVVCPQWATATRLLPLEGHLAPPTNTDGETAIITTNFA